MIDLLFFKKPSITNENNSSFTDKVKELFVFILCMYGVLFIAGIFLKLIDFFIYHESNFSFYDAILKEQKINLKRYPIYYIIIIAPFIEELIFRLPLSLKRKHIPFISIIFFYLLVGKVYDLNINSFNTWIKIVISFLSGLTIYFFTKESLLKVISGKFYIFYFYALSICFGLMHIFNFYKVVPNNLLFIVPLYVIPQIIVGCFAGYIRLKNGFVWGLAIHCIYNTFSVFLSHS